MVYPAAMAYGDVNKWYLVFGSGPNVLDDYTSSENAKLYLLDLDELLTPGSTIGAPAACSVEKIGSVDGLSSTLSNMDIISCDTGVANTFMGSPVNLDWDLDYQADAAYFGLVGDTNATSGQVMRLGMDGSADPTTWTGPTTLVNTNQPVASQPQVGLDNFMNLWIYFGTGRYFSMGDKTSVSTQTLYGVKDLDGATINIGNLLDSTDIEVYTDDDLTVENGPISSTTGVPIINFDELVEEVEDFKLGWYLDLPPIVGTAGVAPSTRSLSQSVLLGGINFSSVFQPSDNPCAGEGNSRLYGLYYKTGTAYANPAIFGTDTVDNGNGVEYRARKYVDLGGGIATSPSIHSGADGDTISVITQMSTADVFRVSAETAEEVRSGKQSWILKE
ncbi:MAG: hypothetical protein PF495_17755 [Spirochaetales bacterium]|nr:hypothetical protein [Spirochaetales bacterium]